MGYRFERKKIFFEIYFLVLCFSTTPFNSLKPWKSFSWQQIENSRTYAKLSVLPFLLIHVTPWAFKIIFFVSNEFIFFNVSIKFINIDWNYRYVLSRHDLNFPSLPLPFFILSIFMIIAFDTKTLPSNNKNQLQATWQETLQHHFTESVIKVAS